MLINKKTLDDQIRSCKFFTKFTAWILAVFFYYVIYDLYKIRLVTNNWIYEIELQRDVTGGFWTNRFSVRKLCNRNPFDYNSYSYDVSSYKVSGLWKLITKLKRCSKIDDNLLAHPECKQRNNHSLFDTDIIMHEVPCATFENYLKDSPNAGDPDNFVDSWFEYQVKIDIEDWDNRQMEYGF